MEQSQNEELPKSKNNLENGELDELINFEGISVWGQHQSVLEEQARDHLEKLTEKASSSKQNLEDGEISENSNSVDNSANSNKKETKFKTLDINQYIASQAKLKESYVPKKQLNVSEKSKRIAESISNRQIDKQSISNERNLQKEPIQAPSSANFKRKYSESVDSYEEGECSTRAPKRLRSPDNCDEVFKSHAEEDASGSEYQPSDDYNSDKDFNPESVVKERKKKSPSPKAGKRLKDDSLISDYNARLSEYERDTSYEDHEVRSLQVPGEIWSKLFSYQQEGVEWLWDLHRREVGGLLVDEMGLGKTVQVIAFFAALSFSEIKDRSFCGLGPTLIVCPVTVIHQWVEHFHKWWPSFRIVLLHGSQAATNKKKLIRTINNENGIIITNYESVLKYKDTLYQLKWHYIVLDEGHKIRNPEAKITVAIKQFHSSSHRIMLTGSPMQNNLVELWSLFDFIVPGRLGTKQVFIDHFATPIVQGGYTNASAMQETTALLIATSLKEMITPYMLRRTKNDVSDSVYLPDKSEQVLFCSLTEEQRDVYKEYLLSDHVGSILGRTSGPRLSDLQKRSNMLVAITTLRKICNHPDLYLGEADDSFAMNQNDISLSFGYYKRSGKMIVVSALLKIWKKQGHRVLLFTQSRSMLEFFTEMLCQQEYKFLKMDGTTPISSRQSLIDLFNKDNSYNVFLLTTKVGGLGINLTGANRVIIYDPDWNPATDLQARERAWRIGQKRQVTVYRLLSAGTIEEKMYQRQVFKQLLSNKVLIDPRTHRFFKSSDLTELFSLQEETDTNPETANIFRNSKININPKKHKNKKSKIENIDVEVSFSEDKIKKMKELAQQIAKNITNKPDVIDTRKDDPRSKERELLKKLTPPEILAYNRKKLIPPEEPPPVNRIDDSETNVSFDKALQLISKKKECKFDDERVVEERNVEKEDTEKDKCKKGKKKKKKDKVKVDTSGKIDGEKVDGLVKIEMKKKEKKREEKADKQDDYVLEKLFSKKGVQTALQHDVIVDSGYKRNSLRVHYEAKLKADMAMKAVRKSRLNSWRW